jgi:transcriptional regulator with XRE-family HTH domain
LNERSFGELLRTFRVAAGLTQEGLAARADMSVRGIADLERGTRRFPYVDTVRRLSHSLGLTPTQHDEFVAAGRRPPRGLRDDRDERPPRSAAMLPLELTTFVGREQLLGQIEALLAAESPPCRLLTLTGPGGTGKTRAATQAARTAVEGFRDGAAFVSLASIVDRLLVVPTICQAVGVPDTRGLDLHALVGYLRDRHMLLLLDNFEQVLSASDDVGSLLASCSDVKLIVTSRAPLHSGRVGTGGAAHGAARWSRRRSGRTPRQRIDPPVR